MPSPPFTCHYTGVVAVNASLTVNDLALMFSCDEIWPEFFKAGCQSNRSPPSSGLGAGSENTEGITHLSHKIQIEKATRNNVLLNNCNFN